MYFVSIAWYLIVSPKHFYRLIMLSIRLNVLKVELNLLTIELSHIPDLILRLYFFNAIFIRVISLATGKFILCLTRAIFLFEYNFLIICRPCKKSEDNVISNRKFTSCNNINALYRLWRKIYVIFIELFMWKDPFAHLKGT